MRLLLAAVVEFTGPNHALTLFGIRLVGVNVDTARKLGVTLALVIALLAVNYGLRGLALLLLPSKRSDRPRFWIRQAIRLLCALALVVGFLSIWFNDTQRLGTFLGLVTAGLAFALQKVVTAFCGYLVILRGNTFSVGDRITMGGVRGDVIKLGFLQTTIMEMGQPPSVNQQADPAMWVKARQYTGRIVTVTNDKLFDEPIYNYTREFPYIWEELTLPVSYTDDRHKAEAILLEAAKNHTTDVSTLSGEAIGEMERRYSMRRAEIKPRVYWRLTDNWLEMTVRFVTMDHAVRDVKDAMAREIITALDAAGIGVASSTYDIVGLPPIRVQSMPERTAGSAANAGGNGRV